MSPARSCRRTWPTSCAITRATARKRTTTSRACTWRWRRRATSSVTTATGSTTARTRAGPGSCPSASPRRTRSARCSSSPPRCPSCRSWASRGRVTRSRTRRRRTRRSRGSAAPDLTLCLSTNGLALPEHVERLAALGVRHVTVTVNMIDPEVGERIYPWIVRDGRKVLGREASRILSERQLEGIARLAEKRVLVKVNSVVIPGVNEAHLPDVVRAVRKAGAFLVNLVPLISAPEHGTHYGMAGQRGPSAEELERVQGSCELDSRVMRHCRQCRADAVGRLGEDRFEAFTLAKLPPGPARDARDLRAERRGAVGRARELAARERQAALLRVADVPAALGARVAVATKGGGLVDQHFGHAREFLVYDVGHAGARLVGRRAVNRYCTGGDGDDDALTVALRALADCDAVLVAKVGHCPKGQLAAAGIEPATDQAFQPIEAAALAWFESFAARVARGEVAPRRARPPAEPAAPLDAARAEVA